MSAYAWELEADVAKEIISADEHRDELVVQLYTDNWTGAGEPVYLGFGETPVSEIGICLGNQGHSVRVLGAKARLAVNAICAGIATGGIETHTSIEYRHTPNYPGWWNDQPEPRISALAILAENIEFSNASNWRVLSTAINLLCSSKGRKND